ncbi:D-ribose-binding periplasmic protein precursor [Symmachiella macrocystis]|uniref:D-ribose-binding periplasmic protein n=1 Tax=Symmachiella macrocystis TaxID=2527985 RepID=A0A5C6BPI5_9PLAN|nr:substrate-binding domain-containing protein [Symmachiella macrocystis]TWU14113.1 D-ribose-binding periplasmic protein precursor [Symmachiella macrocystis]
MTPRIFLVGILALAVGCGGDDTSSPETNTGSGEKQYTIAVIPKGTSHVFWKSVHAGAQNAADELGNVEVLWKGPLLESDTKGQVDVVQDFIVKNVDGICLAPLDSQALIEHVNVAKEAGIPVVIFDSGLDDESNTVSYVATDNWHGGELAAQTLAESIGGKGNVILLRYKTGSESTEQREEGFLAKLKEAYPEVNVISSDQYAGVTPEEAFANATQILQRYEGQVNGIFAVCEPNGEGVRKAIEQLGLTGKVKFVGFDPNEPLIDGLSNDQVHGIVLQDPVKMGYEAVMSMMKHLQGEDVEKRIVTGEYVATPKNMNTEEMQRLLKPEQY